jgi:sodium/hydrogen exchanger 8
MARYAIPNLSTSGKRQINSFYHALAYNFETTIFLFIGIGFIGFDLDWKAMGPGLLVWSIIGISAGRFVNIYCMTRLSNLYRSRTAISKEWMFLMWFSGLRGAMAYALSLESVNLFVHEDQGNIMLTITLFIVMVNVRNYH